MLRIAAGWIAGEAVEDSETPLAVVLTPGPFNETYFEHAYLARQLGFSLVEGSDLTVRDDIAVAEDVGGLKRARGVPPAR